MTIEKFIEIRCKEAGRKVLLADARKFEPTSYRYARSLDHRSMTIFVPSGNVERQVKSYKAMDKDKKYKFKILTRYFDSEGNLRKEKLTNAN